MQPQHICPGASNKMLSLKDGEPKNAAYVRRAVELMAEGLVQVHSSPANSMCASLGSISPLPCPLAAYFSLRGLLPLSNSHLATCSLCF